MKILFTGGSSFTGFWFIKTLALAGHSVTAIVQKPLESYTGVRKARIEALKAHCDLYFDTPYASPSFFDLIGENRFDLFCHHAADVTNYKSPDFDPVSALKNNVGPITQVLEALKKTGCKKIVLTGSVFEQREGAGSQGLRAVSPYGLSKGLTADVFKYYAETHEFLLGKFVIPNPFGPFEEFRFTSFLVQNWFEKKSVAVTLPSYVRDNIHVSLLAKAYEAFVKSLSDSPGYKQINPSGYPESQGAFTKRFSEAMQTRLNLPCNFTLGIQNQFPEPKVRLNTDLLDTDALGWKEEKAWDELAEYYEMTFSPLIHR